MALVRRYRRLVDDFICQGAHRAPAPQKVTSASFAGIRRTRTRADLEHQALRPGVMQRFVGGIHSVDCSATPVRPFRFRGCNITNITNCSASRKTHATGSRDAHARGRVGGLDGYQLQASASTRTSQKFFAEGAYEWRCARFRACQETPARAAHGSPPAGRVPHRREENTADPKMHERPSIRRARQKFTMKRGSDKPARRDDSPCFASHSRPGSMRTARRGYSVAVLAAACAVGCAATARI